MRMLFVGAGIPLCFADEFVVKWQMLSFTSLMSKRSKHLGTQMSSGRKSFFFIFIFFYFNKFHNHRAPNTLATLQNI